MPAGSLFPAFFPARAGKSSFRRKIPETFGNSSEPRPEITIPDGKQMTVLTADHPTSHIGQTARPGEGNRWRAIAKGHGMQNLQIGQFADITIFTIKSGKREELIELQRAGPPAIGAFEGFCGLQLYQARDSDQAIQVAFFDDQAAHQRFLASKAFQQHRQRVQPLLAAVVSACFTLSDLVASGPKSLRGKDRTRVRIMNYR